MSKSELELKIQKKIDNKTKPLGSLGRLEEIALKLGLIQNTSSPEIRNPKVLVFAGDHGIALDGVSLYPQEVTYQMVLNFLRGGAAISVFCKKFGIDLRVIDAGVNYNFDFYDSRFYNFKVGKGTKSFLNHKAMTETELQKCLENGKQLISHLHQEGLDWVGFGEMGIGNTSSASMIMSELLDLPLKDCVGRGTGHNDEGLKKKLSILEKAKTFHSLKNPTPFEVLQTFGGFEIATMVGAMLESFERRIPIIVDGFIVSSAFLCAYKIQPKITELSFFAHLSDEKGHKLLLDTLGAKPLLNLNMRLGEGTGAAMSYPIFQAALAFLNEMASFEDAGVSKAE